jgi:hypothetical protein
VFKPTLEVLEDRTMPSFVNAAPETIGAAATDLSGIASALATANAAAVAPTTGVVPVAADEVSAATAAIFAKHAAAYQALSARVAAFHEMFVQTLAGARGAYAATEAANAGASG